MLHVRATSIPAALWALALLSSLALGQAAPGDGKGKGRLAACRTDLATFCQNVDAGGGRKIACLAQHRDKLSAECAAVVDARKAGVKLGADAGAAPPAAAPSAPAPGKGVAGPPLGLRKACAGDLAAHCKEVEKGAGRRMACLQQMLPKLTSECSAAITAAVEQRKAVRVACAGDRKSLCAGQKGPEAMACLRTNRERLSAACAELLATVPVPRKKAEAAPPAQPK